MARRTWGYAAVGVLVVAGTGWLVLHRAGPAEPATTGPAVGTATVVRTNVTAHTVLTGILGYLGPLSVLASGGGGVLTWLPDAGATVGPDQRLYEVDGRPVLLWTGARPAWRDLAPGIPDGPDVAQLERNLVALGYGAGVTVDEHFTAATGTAVRRWQAAHGLPRTGAVPLGQVVFLPGAVRVGAVPVAPGAPLAPGLEILRVTSTGKAVTVNLDASRQGSIHAGDHVTVTLPGGRATSGTVAAASTAPAPAPAPANGNGAANGAPNGAPNAGTAVTIGLDDAGAANGLDSGTAQVTFVTAEHDAVLAVPVDALLAAPGGGYRVAVVDGTGRRLVTVHCGLFDETGGLVEVTGDLTPGMRVEVPA
jgi:peptidoglycan hydrolase-like protein with peptidoglycan-binding domain